MTQQKIIDNFDRGKLCEGRNYGLGYSVLKKVDEGFETLMPFTACKDYINDFAYIESTGKPLTKIYGFEHIHVGILEGKDHLFMGLKALNSNHQTIKHELFDKVEDALINNYKNIIKVINNIEKIVGCNDLSEFEAIVDNVLIIKVPIYWTKFSFLFSMYGLLIRWFLNTTEEESNKDVLTLIQEKKNTLIATDAIMIIPLQKFFANLNMEKLLNYSYPEGVTSSTIHNEGILGRLRKLEIN